MTDITKPHLRIPNKPLKSQIVCCKLWPQNGTKCCEQNRKNIKKPKKKILAKPFWNKTNVMYYLVWMTFFWKPLPVMVSMLQTHKQTDMRWQQNANLSEFAGPKICCYIMDGGALATANASLKNCQNICPNANSNKSNKLVWRMKWDNCSNVIGHNNHMVATIVGYRACDSECFKNRIITIQNK